MGCPTGTTAAFAPVGEPPERGDFASISDHHIDNGYSDAYKSYENAAKYDQKPYLDNHSDRNKH
jgi:hypothetical protein